MLEPELKKKWCAALRSGKYLQGHRSLGRDNHYCCLGVLADILGKLKKIGEENGVVGEGGFCTGVLPIEMAEEVGINNQSDYWARNDGNEDANIKRHTFAEIADWIEAEQ